MPTKTRGAESRLLRFIEAVALGNTEYDELSREARELLDRGVLSLSRYPRRLIFQRGESLPPDPERQNGERARAALRAVEAFANDYGEAPTEDNGVKDRESAINNLHQNLGDLVCDIAHLCDATGIEFAGVVGRAKFHYESETEGQGRGAQLETF